jgi:hypothetical protein
MSGAGLTKKERNFLDILVVVDAVPGRMAISEDYRVTFDDLLRRGLIMAQYVITEDGRAALKEPDHFADVGKMVAPTPP